jgi:hypothetical protein
MQRKKLYMTFVFAGILVLIVAGIALAFTQPAHAQCGSQASSCKNCHEVQGQDPVNNDGKPWHTSHAFGDFCYICHAGNQQATDKAAAHTGMVSPLSDIKASCAQCHPNDLQARAQVYASILGVDISAGGSTASSPTTASTATPAPAGQSSAPSGPANAAVAAPAVATLDANDPNLVDYVKRYDENVLGIYPTNWGNIILMVMIGLLLVGGGGFVITREKLVNVSFGDTKKADGEYPVDVVDMLPEIASLKTKTRKSLKRVLDNPKKADKVLGLMDAVVSDDDNQE